MSRLSIDSNLKLKRRDSYDDIAQCLNDIEMGLSVKRTRQAENLQRRVQTAQNQNNRIHGVVSSHKEQLAQKSEKAFRNDVLNLQKIVNKQKKVTKTINEEATKLKEKNETRLDKFTHAYADLKG